MTKRIRLLSLILLIAPFSARAQQPQNPLADLETYDGCGMTGDAKSPGVMALNRLKNRYVAPTDAQVNLNVNLAPMLAPGNDVGRWKTKFGAEIVGYVNDVKPGGIETVNCHAKDLENRDTHIEIVIDPMSAGATRRVIIEVTPRWRAIMAQQGIDWSTRGLRDHFLGRWVRVRGWMLFDVEHQNESENTAPGRNNDWRATAWEIHPITALTVVPRPR